VKIVYFWIEQQNSGMAPPMKKCLHGTNKQIQANKEESKLPSIPATDQFINWWDASNSCFSAL